MDETFNRDETFDRREFLNFFARPITGAVSETAPLIKNFVDFVGRDPILSRRQFLKTAALATGSLLILGRKIGNLETASIINLWENESLLDLTIESVAALLEIKAGKTLAEQGIATKKNPGMLTLSEFVGKATAYYGETPQRDFPAEPIKNGGSNKPYDEVFQKAFAGVTINDLLEFFVNETSETAGRVREKARKFKEEGLQVFPDEFKYLAAVYSSYEDFASTPHSGLAAAAELAIQKREEERDLADEEISEIKTGEAERVFREIDDRVFEEFERRGRSKENWLEPAEIMGWFFRRNQGRFLQSLVDSSLWFRFLARNDFRDGKFMATDEYVADLSQRFTKTYLDCFSVFDGNFGYNWAKVIAEKKKTPVNFDLAERNFSVLNQIGTTYHGLGIAQLPFYLPRPAAKFTILCGIMADPTQGTIKALNDLYRLKELNSFMKMVNSLIDSGKK